MIHYLAHYSWAEGNEVGGGRAFIGFEFEPSSKHIMEAEKRMSDESKQKILILSLTKIAGEVGK